MERFFRNKSRQLKSFWKILMCLIAFNLMSLVAVLLASVIFQNVHITSFSDMISNTMNTNLGYVLAILITSVFFYFFYNLIIKKEKIFWKDLGFTKEHKLSSIVKGFALGAIVTIIYISLLISMKQLEFEFRPMTADIFYSLLMGLIIFAGVAFIEEITFRGYFQYLLSKNNKWSGLILTAIVFALNHLINATNYTLLSLVYLVIGGILFGLIRMGTNNIWFPIGYHVAWNWIEIRIFGLGNSSDYHWFSTKITQNTIWNGGETGSGLILIFTELVLIAAFAYLYRKKSK